MKVEDCKIGMKIVDKTGCVLEVEEIYNKRIVATNDCLRWTIHNLDDYEIYERDTKPINDTVNHPSHYTNSEIECIDAITSATSNLNGTQGYLVGNIIKYVWRYKFKNGVEDLKKAKWYLERLIKEVEK